MVNRVSSYFPKGGNSATQTELKLIQVGIFKKNPIERSAAATAAAAVDDVSQ